MSPLCKLCTPTSSIRWPEFPLPFTGENKPNSSVPWKPFKHLDTMMFPQRTLPSRPAIPRFLPHLTLVQPHTGATADIGPALTLCLCSSAVLPWGRGWPRWHQGVCLRPGPEGTAPQCESLVRLDAWPPRYLESSTHVPGSALTVSPPAHSFSTAGLGPPVFP